MENKGITVKTIGERVELTAPHGKGELNFLVPHACWATSGKTFVEAKNFIKKEGLIFPTLAEVASVVYAAWQNPNEEYSKRVINLLEHESLWTNNGILYVPNKGMYIQDSPNVVWGKHFNESELIKRFEAGDKNVRFTPFEEEYFGLNAKDLVKSKLLIALAGEEGAEKLSYVATKYGVKGHSLPYSGAKYEKNERKIDSRVIHLCSRTNFMISGSDVNFFPDRCYSLAIQGDKK